MFIVIGRDNESVTHREWTQDRSFNSRESADAYIAKLDEACARWEFDITYYVREVEDRESAPVTDEPVTAAVKVHQTSPMG